MGPDCWAESVRAVPLLGTFLAGAVPSKSPLQFLPHLSGFAFPCNSTPHPHPAFGPDGDGIQEGAVGPQDPMPLPCSPPRICSLVGVCVKWEQIPQCRRAQPQPVCHAWKSAHGSGTALLLRLCGYTECTGWFFNTYICICTHIYMYKYIMHM